MANFALVENGIVERVIVADKFEHAAAFFDPANLIEETEATGLAWVGSEVIGGRFKPVQSGASWTWDADLFGWVPPTPKPNVPAYWDEESLSWVEITLPAEPEVTNG